MRNESGRAPLCDSRLTVADPVLVLVVSGRGVFEERSSFEVSVNRRLHRRGR